ncbi:MAG: aminotransferase class I/II-fold pyridoxal phosphate-dependent enzyme [Acidimicrobiales bacterium]
MSRIYLSPPDVREAERRLLIEALESNWVAPVGPDLTAFEEEAARVAGRAHGVALSSGTAALHLALLELRVGAGDDVIVSSFTFAASANAIRYVGAQPVFVDSDRSSWNLSPDLLTEELEAREREGRALPAAVIAVDLYGQCADYDRLVPLCADRGIVLIEDAAEAIGATSGGRSAGSFGEVGVLSFNGNKLITSGGGGMLVCDRPELAQRARYLATQARQDAPHYEHTEVGYNYRLSNLLAAVGRGQLRTLGERIARRREIREHYREALAAWPGIAFGPTDDEGNAWLTCITVDPQQAGVDREGVRLHLEAQDIESRPLWKPMHLQPVFRHCSARVDGTSEQLFATGLCLPSGSGMSPADQDRVITALDDALPT